MKRGVLFTLSLLSSLVLLISFSINFALAITVPEGKCVGGSGDEGQFLTKEEGGCCLGDDCCNYPATQNLCSQAKKDLVPFKEIENTKEDEDLFKDKGKLVGKIESLENKVEVKQEDGTWKQLKLGDEVKFLDHIRVGKGGKAEIKLIDGATYTISENSYLVIDEFVYNPNESFLERTFSKYTEAFSRWVIGIVDRIDKRYEKMKQASAAAVRG